MLLISLHQMNPVEALSNLETQKVGKSFGRSARAENLPAGWAARLK
jgi:hypothetical protein